jgi:hypothetical protein
MCTVISTVTLRHDVQQMEDYLRQRADYFKSTGPSIVRFKGSRGSVYADRKPRSRGFSDAEDSVGDSSSTGSSGSGTGGSGGSESESESDVEAGVAFKPGARHGPSKRSRHDYLPASVSTSLHFVHSLYCAYVCSCMYVCFSTVRCSRFVLSYKL